MFQTDQSRLGNYAMMTLKPSETILIGGSINENGRTVMDDVGNRINELITTYLVQVAKDRSGWFTLYRDPSDGRFWEHSYPHSEMHGGGPAQLTCLPAEIAKEKYGISES